MSYKRDLFKEISDHHLSNLILNEYNYLVDEYIEAPIINIAYLDGSLAKVLTTGCITSEFNDFLECVQFIEKLRTNSFFFLYRISIEDKKVIIRYINPSLNLDIFGKQHIRKQRIRDRKITQILNDRE